MREWFARASRKASNAAGSPYSFVVATISILVWAACGPVFGWSDTWQLIANTGTTVVTFLLVFLVQGSQNRDTRAIQIKLNDLLCAIDKADDKLIDLEEGTEADMKQAKERQASSPP